MNVLDDQPLGSRNTLALDASASALVEVARGQDLVEALAWADERTLPVLPLGQGSNVVLADDLQCLVVVMQTRGVDLLETSTDAVMLRVAAGENWHELVGWCVEKGYYGLENLALIPGTVGAAPIQNIGAYGVELASTLQAVHATRLADGQAIVIDSADCAFGYRDSVFKGALKDTAVITAVDLRLSREPVVDISYPALAAEFDGAVAEPSPRAVYDAVVNVRSRKLPDPAVVPNAGSFFKNPVFNATQAQALGERFPALPQYPQDDGSVKVPAAWMIQHCGWKGIERDGVGVHPEHALVLVNRGSNSGSALLALADDIAASVNDTFGVQLVIEPRVYGHERA
ncbi:MAG: UDP-N-acetylmuramate dehydrogenase [Halioglobus sp.]